MTTENIKVKVENEEVIIDEKERKFRPIKFVKDKLANVPAAVKYVGAGIAGAVAVTAAGAAIVNKHNRDELDDGLGDLVIEDFDSDPAEMVEAEE